jgi:hypothetical protein
VRKGVGYRRPPPYSGIQERLAIRPTLRVSWLPRERASSCARVLKLSFLTHSHTCTYLHLPKDILIHRHTMTLTSLDKSSQKPIAEPEPEPTFKRRNPFESPPSDTSSGAINTEADVCSEPAIDSSFPALQDPIEGAEAFSRAKDRKTGCYRSSVYVDAFDLALDTVLKEESYLFDYAEQEIFAKYRSLDYEAQHLYVAVPPAASVILIQLDMFASFSGRRMPGSASTNCSIRRTYRISVPHVRLYRIPLLAWRTRMSSSLWMRQLAS